MSAPAASALAMSPEELHAAVGDHRDAVPERDVGAVVDRRHLRHPDPGDDAGGADRVVDDRVVGDEAVRRAVDLDVVDGHREAEFAALELLDDLVTRRAAASRAARRAGLCTTSGSGRRWFRRSPPADPGSAVDARESCRRARAEHAEQLGQLARGVAEADAPSALDVAVADRSGRRAGPAGRAGSPHRYRAGRCFSSRLPNSARRRAHWSE